MSENTKIKVKVITSLIGDGRSVEKETAEMELRVRDLDPSAFVDDHVDNFTDHGGRSYKYMDCVKETFVIGGEKRCVFYVRYRLDAEKENFKDFIRDLKPADFLKNSM